MGEAEDKYLNKLKTWLGKGRYVESFSDDLERTRARLGKDLPDPETDTLKAYKDLTQRMAEPSINNLSVQGFMSTIDLSILNQTWGTKRIRQELEIAKKYNVAAVCVYGDRVKEAVEYLKDTSVAVAAAIGFDKSQNTLEQKVQEAKDALDASATEIDMPINLSRFFSGKDDSREYDHVYNELKAVWEVCLEKGANFKIIANVDSMDEEWRKDKENYVLGGNNPYIIKYCELVKRLQGELPGGYHQLMFKTSTGFDFKTVNENGDKNYEGAKLPGALRIFREQSKGTNIGVKAAGKERTAEDFIEDMAQFGVVRYGCTATPKIYNRLMELEYRTHRPAA